MQIKEGKKRKWLRFCLWADSAWHFFLMHFRHCCWDSMCAFTLIEPQALGPPSSFLASSATLTRCPPRQAPRAHAMYLDYYTLLVATGHSPDVVGNWCFFHQQRAWLNTYLCGFPKIPAPLVWSIVLNFFGSVVLQEAALESNLDLKLLPAGKFPHT